MSGVNLRILTERVMALEARVAKLEVALIGPQFESDLPSYGRSPAMVVPNISLFTVQARGRWWYCVSSEGVKVNDTGLSKEDAQKLADDMNGATKEMVDA